MAKPTTSVSRVPRAKIPGIITSHITGGWSLLPTEPPPPTPAAKTTVDKSSPPSYHLPKEVSNSFPRTVKPRNDRPMHLIRVRHGSLHRWLHCRFAHLRPRFLNRHRERPKSRRSFDQMRNWVGLSDYKVKSWERCAVNHHPPTYVILCGPRAQRPRTRCTITFG